MAEKRDEAGHWTQAWCEAQLRDICDMVQAFKAEVRAAVVEPGDLIGLGRKLRAAATLVRFVIQVQRLGAALVKRAARQADRDDDGMAGRRGDGWDDASEAEIEAELGRRLTHYRDLVEEKGCAWRQSTGGDAGRAAPPAGRDAPASGAAL